MLSSTALPPSSIRSDVTSLSGAIDGGCSRCPLLVPAPGGGLGGGGGHAVRRTGDAGTRRLPARRLGPGRGRRRHRQQSCRRTRTPSSTPPCAGDSPQLPVQRLGAHERDDEIAANAGQLGDVVVIELGYNDKPGRGGDRRRARRPDRPGRAPRAVGRPEHAQPARVRGGQRSSAGGDDPLADDALPRLGRISHGHPRWFIADDGVGVHLTKAGSHRLRRLAEDAARRHPRHRRAAAGGPALLGRGGHRLADAAPAAPPPDGPDAGAGFTGVSRSACSTLAPAARSAPAAPSSCRSPAGRVPPGATAAVLNVTAVDPCGAGFLTVFPCGSAAPPLASNVNFGPARPGPTSSWPA